MLDQLNSPKPQIYEYPTAFSHWGEEEREAILRVIDSGQFTMGPEVAAFEKDFADWHGMKHGIMTNSGSSANLLIVATLMHLNLIRRGDKVVVPALAWSTTYAPLVQYGLDLVLADCDATWNANNIGRYVDNNTALVVGCSILGNPADLSRLEEWCKGYGAIFIEDNCESLGAVTHDGLRCGSVGAMNSFSFFYSHQLSAIEGGMVLTNDDTYAYVCRMFRAHGWTRDSEELPPMTFEDEYNFRVFGYNLRPTEIHAAVARVQLRKQGAFAGWRRRNYRHFWRVTGDLPITVQKVDRYSANPFGMAFLVPERCDRGKLVAAFRDAGIDCRLPTGGSFRLHRYGHSYCDQETPFADSIHRRGLFLGNAPFSIEDKIDAAVEVMKAAL